MPEILENRVTRKPRKRKSDAAPPFAEEDVPPELDARDLALRDQLRFFTRGLAERVKKMAGDAPLDEVRGWVEQLKRLAQ